MVKKFFRKKIRLPKVHFHVSYIKMSWKYFWQSLKHRCMAIAFMVCLALAAGFWHWYGVLTDRDVDQTAASRWQAGEQTFTQLSVFFSPEEAFHEKDRISLLSQLQMKFQEQSIRNESERGGDSALLKDCYSCETKLMLSNGTKTAQAVVTATGGDFFYFHPQIWLSGYAYADSDIMQDRIVLDRELAWTLFGSSQVEGMAVTIQDKTYYVAGVVDRRKDAETKAVYGESNRAWISYTALETMQEMPAITAYEIVMPSPISGWAEEILSNALDAEDREAVLLENSKRAHPWQVLKSLKDFTKRSVVTKAVKYPYWENAARIRDCKRELCLFAIIISLLYPCLLGIQSIVCLYRFLCRGLAVLKQKFS